jgi:hypothetical protein
MVEHVSIQMDADCINRVGQVAMGGFAYEQVPEQEFLNQHRDDPRCASFRIARSLP